MRVGSSSADKPCIARLVEACLPPNLHACFQLLAVQPLLMSFCAALTWSWTLQYAFGAKRGLWITLPPQLIVMVSSFSGSAQL